MYRMGIVTTVYYRNSLTIDLSNAPKTITKQHENDFGRTLLACPRSRMIKGILKRTRRYENVVQKKKKKGEREKRIELAKTL